MLNYGSVCSGIEAASVAWEPLGWRPAFFSEIEPFPSAVLAARFGSNMPGEPLPKNGVPNHGDFTKIDASAGPIDLLVGGTPCQSFSVAGKRLGMDDPRGNLALEYLALARRLRPRWIVWENVPGVLSSRSGDGSAAASDADGLADGGDETPSTSDFATFLAYVRECGYGFAYRILDAQYVRVSGYERAVPQRRRRLFVVGYLGDWRPAAAVLFEPDGVPGHPPPRRQAGKGVSRTFGARSGCCSSNVDDTRDGQPIAADVASTLNASFGAKLGLENQHIDSGAPLFVAHTLRGEGFKAGEDGCGRGTPLVPVCFDSKGTQVQTDESGQLAVVQKWAVRRLTPRECERLQGFPDDWTQIPWRRKDAANCPDGPRYKAIGNSMAVNVMRWIGERIDLFERLMRK